MTQKYDHILSGLITVDLTAAAMGPGWQRKIASCRPEPDLSLLVIDMDDSCVVKVEKGDLPDMAGSHWCGTKLLVFDPSMTFDRIRHNIDALDGEKPVPRIERQHEPHSQQTAYRVYKDGGSVWHNTEYLDALFGLANVKVPVHEAKKGEWKRLNTHDWAEARKAAGEAGYGIRISLFEEAWCPVKVWRYTRGESNDSE